MDRRRALVAISCLPALGVSALATAQQENRVWRIGFLGSRSRSTESKRDTYYDAFVEGMRALGYSEGTNLLIEWRFADGNYDKLPKLAADLVNLKVDVIVAHGTVGTKAAQNATRTIPIVTTSLGDPVTGGFATSLGRPGGNITGVANIALDTSSKRLELLAIMMPKLSRVAVFVNADNPIGVSTIKKVHDAAQRMRVTVVSIGVRTQQDLERGFAEMTQQRVDAVVFANDAFFLGQARQLGEATLKHRLPSIAPYREIALGGGLMAYAQDFTEGYRRAATYVHKILKGAKPGDLPIEQPTNLQLIINRKTAKAFGLTIPNDLMLRADEVIE